MNRCSTGENNKEKTGDDGSDKNKEKHTAVYQFIASIW